MHLHTTAAAAAWSAIDNTRPAGSQHAIGPSSRSVKPPADIRFHSKLP
jgi:hypothetical protein